MNRPTWRNVSWLYSECYLYRYFPGTRRANSRLLHSMFASTIHWKTYDPFLRQKDEAFKTSKKGVVELADRFREFAESLPSHSSTEDSETEKLLFVQPHIRSRANLISRKKWPTFAYGAMPPIYPFPSKEM